MKRLFKNACCLFMFDIINLNFKCFLFVKDPKYCFAQSIQQSKDSTFCLYSSNHKRAFFQRNLLQKIKGYLVNSVLKFVVKYIELTSFVNIIHHFIAIPAFMGWQ